MASDGPVKPEMPVDADIEIIGVRLQSSSQVRFFAADTLDAKLGAWVLIPVDEEYDVGRVVITAPQVLHHPFQEPLRLVVRVLSEDDVNTLSATVKPEHGKIARRMGRLGKLPEPTSISQETALESVEDALHRGLKQSFPQLGDIISVQGEPATVIAIQVHKGLVTAKMGDSDTEHTFHIDTWKSST